MLQYYVAYAVARKMTYNQVWISNLSLNYMLVNICQFIQL